MLPSEKLTNFENPPRGDSWNGKQSGAIMSPHTFEPCVVLRPRHVIPTAKCWLILAVAAICCWPFPALLVQGAAVNHQVKSHNIVGLYSWNNFSEMVNDGASGGTVNEVPDAELASTITVDLQLPQSDLAQMSAESSVVEAAAKANTGCPPTTSSHCLRCNPVGCVKCTAYLVTDTRQCVDQCPSGYIDQWSAHTEFMGRVCTPTNYSGALVAGIAGLLGGFLVCFSLLAVAVMVVRRKRRRKSIKQKLINETTMDRSDFLRQLNSMRPNAEYFLAMLNDTRRQIRKLYLSGEVAAANSYRPIVRDLAKILILLNRPIELIPSAPHDWTRLHAWSEHALERYKPQVGQLIDFFQTPLGEDFDAAAFQQKTQIFRHGPMAGTAQPKGATKAGVSHKLHMFGSLISLHEFEEPRASDPFGSTFNTLKGGNLITDLNASSLWLEDEFYKLGFRPQDEITTEL